MSRRIAAPGPWTVVRERDAQGWKGIGIKAADGRFVATIVMQPTDDEAANAALIAAAPELLAVARAFVAKCDEVGIKDYNTPLLPRARAALAKAESPAC